MLEKGISEPTVLLLGVMFYIYRMGRRLYSRWEQDSQHVAGCKRFGNGVLLCLVPLQAWCVSSAIWRDEEISGAMLNGREFKCLFHAENK